MTFSREKERMSPTEVTYFWQKSNLGDAPISPYIAVIH